MPRRTVAVPGVRLADGAAALHTDRGHSLRSLLPPQAALPSLPRNDTVGSGFFARFAMTEGIRHFI